MDAPPLHYFRLCAIATVLVYALNARAGIAVGEARKKFGVPLPKTTGPPEFERVFRAHCNNAEQYPQFLALMWAFAFFCDPTAAGILGIGWVVLRNLYVTEYHKRGDNVQKFTIPAYMILSLYSVGIVTSIVWGVVHEQFF